MAITKNFVEMMNGDIHVDSEKGVGSVFTVTVTLGASDRQAQAAQGIDLPENLRALVVDDDEIACEHGRIVLQSIGIEADTAASGSEGIAIMRDAHAKGRGYDLLLTDYKMPGMNGLELTRELRSFDEGKTAVIVLTGYNWDIIDEDARRDGVDGIIAKPLYADSLLQQIHNVLLHRSGIEPAEAEEEPAQESSLAGRRILIVEDVEQNAEILQDLLEIEDVLTEHAENGAVALEMFGKHPAGYYDAILMDMRMPVMDGLEATRVIRSSGKEDAKSIPIIALTANAFDEDVQRSLQAGLNAHLSKPVEPNALFETLENLISAGASKN
jgi:CheY-like chemotaxis protein